jgi:hypothetical protein
MDITDGTLCRLTALVLQEWADAAADDEDECDMSPERRRAVNTARFAAAAIGWALSDIARVDGAAT